jgi:hypothetical protein
MPASCAERDPAAKTAADMAATAAVVRKKLLFMGTLADVRAIG